MKNQISEEEKEFKKQFKEFKAEFNLYVQTEFSKLFPNLPMTLKYEWRKKYDRKKK